MLPSQPPLPFGPDSSVPPTLDALVRLAPGPAPGAWDELRGDDGSARSVWRRFASLVPPPADGRTVAEAFDRRVRRVAEQLRQDGVTHNVFDEHGAETRPWSLELLPLIIEPDDWARIERGVLQRAALLEAMLEDLYGERRLLHDGLLPPALLLRHPGYLRPMHGVRPAGGQRLQLIAFDVARGVDGGWRLVAQRTQGPSGLGYVLHNRLVISRQFPDPFREMPVQHLASSYRRLIDALEQRAQAVAGGAAPRIVLLTPGRYSETYFEHAYLARYLGIPLVEGGDLTVRGDRLFLKTVEGLEPVHGVLRRLDDEWCDPLELRPDSALGVPGLLRAARAGTVVLANALGSAILESPALQGFLPGIAQRLLGEELSLPALATWWCGEAAAFETVRTQMAGKLLRTTFPRDGRTSQVRQAPAQGIAADPDAWTVQERMRFSRVPVWSGGRAIPRPAMVRVYAIADAAGRWHALPGGMTRAAASDDGSVSMQRGGSSLDTWVLTRGRVDAYSMLPQRLSVDDIAQRRRPVTSRTAENLFWLGRYTERTEQLVRLVRVTLMRIDADDEAEPEVLQGLSALAVRKGLVPAGVPTLAQAPHVFERALLDALGDADGAFSVAFNLQALSRSAQALRERLSVDQWTLMRAMTEDFADGLRGPEGALPDRAQAMPLLDRLALRLGAATGAQTDRMNRDHGWRLLAVGRLIDRLIGVTARFEAFIEAGAAARPVGIDLLLELFDSAITFRARYQRHDDLLALVDLLVFDSNNPRAYAGVLRRLRTELTKLPGDAAGTAALLAHLPADGPGLTLDQLRDADDAQIGERMLALSRELGQRAQDLADAIGQRYFALAGTEPALQWV